ncbi:MAG: glucose 1-dehydrogenase [Dehalococcoidia bacterium]|nr:glucose 1-dehydrogenase [Dehalococcoidia bacterium]
MRLQGKVAIITGASTGIGRAAAILFALEGARVAVVADRDIEGARQTVAAVERDGGHALFIQANIAREADATRIATETVARFGALHILYNNAAIAPGTDNFIETTPEDDWQRILDVNLKGAYLCIKHAVPYMERSGGGAIVNTSSLNGVIALGPLAYGASKMAVVSLTRSLAQELGPRNIRVNCIAPGYVDTEMTRRLRRMQPNMTEEQQDQRMHAFAGRTPLRRVAQPDEIARAALFFASDDSSFVTGQILTVDGGYMIQ